MFCTLAIAAVVVASTIASFRVPQRLDAPLVWITVCVIVTVVRLMIYILRYLNDLMTLNCGNYGIFLIMDNAVCISSNVCRIWSRQNLRLQRPLPLPVSMAPSGGAHWQSDEKGDL